MNQKGQTPVLLLAGIVLVLALAGGIFYLGRVTAPKSQPQNVITQPSPTSDETVHTESDRSANWKTYTHNSGRYTFKYPQNLILKEYNQEGSFKYIDITIDGRNAIRSSEIPGISINDQIYVQNEGKIYQLGLAKASSDTWKIIGENTFNQILSTLKFTN